MTKKKLANKKVAKKKNHPIHVLSLGLSLGILGAAVVFITGAFAMVSGWWPQSFVIVGEWYKGFGPTEIGVLLGTIYGFFDGFVAGILIGWLYNELYDIVG